MADAPLHTIVDVLEGALDGDLSRDAVARLSEADVDELADLVATFYAAWTLEPPAEGVMRVHLGGWVAQNAAAAPMMPVVNNALLYAHEILVHDQVAAFLYPRRSSLRALPPIRDARGPQIAGDQAHIESTGGWFAQRSLEGAHSYLGDGVEMLAALAPLIRAGVVLPIPHLQVARERQEGILTATIRTFQDPEFGALVSSPIDELPLTRDDLRGFPVKSPRPKTPFDAALQDFGGAAYYLNRTIAIADAFHASYVPPSATDWALYEHRLGDAIASLPHGLDLDLRVMAALGRARLPLLDNVDLETMVKIRQGEEAFEDWRRELRVAGRAIEMSTTDPAHFAAEGREVLDDLLQPMVAAVKDSQTVRARITSSSADAAGELVLGAAAAGAAHAAGFPATQTLVEAAGFAAARWAFGTLFPRRAVGAKSIVGHLVRGGGASLPARGDEQTLYISPKFD